MSIKYRPEIIQNVFIDFIGARLQPFWSLTAPKLQLISRRALGDDLTALQFKTNRVFQQRAYDWQGGQHINLTIPINGVYHQRSYSLVGLPQQLLWWHDEPDKNFANVSDDHNSSGKQKNSNHKSSNQKSPKNNNKQKTKLNETQQRSTVTIAIKSRGLVSDYLVNSAPIGSIFDCSLPSGDFTLAQANSAFLALTGKTAAPLLFIAGGSGITPMLGLITRALEQAREVTLLYYNRSSLSQSPLQVNWQQLAAQYPTFTYHLINTDDSATYLADTRHLTAQSLRALNLPLANTQIFACGSPALLASLYQAADEITTDTEINNSLSSDNRRTLRDNIVIERFAAILPDLNSEVMANNAETHTVYLRARQRQFDSASTLLIDAEQAGLRLNYGCRQGICHMCSCNKVSGVVKNIQTGKLSGDGAEPIQTCITIAMTDVILDI